VQLSNLANGTVVADAVRVYQIGVAPTIGAVTADPNPVTAGASVALTASDVVAVNSGSTIIQVAFYLDNGGHNGLDSADTLLGYGTQNPDGTWTLTFSTTGWRPGTYRLLAQALDSYGVLSDPLELDLQVSA